MKVAIVDYNAGNIYSVIHALHRVGIMPIVTDKAEEILSADRVLFPGQGEARSTMASLKSKGLDKLIPSLKQPVLGICIGQQLMCSHSEEEDTDCLGIFPNLKVQRFVPQSREDKIPHIGWNTIEQLSSPLFAGLREEDYVYYIHSYYVPVCEQTIATTHYAGVAFSAALRKDNFFATQFHPEKSGDVGERLLQNFIDLQF